MASGLIARFVYFYEVRKIVWILLWIGKETNPASSGAGK